MLKGFSSAHWVVAKMNHQTKENIRPESAANQIHDLTKVKFFFKLRMVLRRTRSGSVR